jgi:CHAD domain-containing protein
MTAADERYGVGEDGRLIAVTKLSDRSQSRVIKRLHKQAKSLSRRLGRMIESPRIDERDVKDARVAIRRLRATILLSDRLLPRTMRNELKRNLRSVARQFGPIRDLDVLRIRFVATMHLWDEVPEMVGASLLVAIDRARESAVESLSKKRSRHAQEELRHLLSTMRAYLNSDAIDDRMLTVEKQHRQVHKQCAKSFDRLERDAAHLKKKCSDDDLHKLRVVVKQTRYLLLYASEILGADEAKLFASQLADLQTRLGDHQDAVVAAAWLQAFVRKTKNPQELALARKLLVEQQRVIAETRKEWRTVWRSVKSSPAKQWLKNP